MHSRFFVFVFAGLLTLLLGPSTVAANHMKNFLTAPYIRDQSSTAAANYGYQTKTIVDKPPPKTMTVPHGCATPVSVSKLEEAPHGLFEFPEVEVNDGYECCEACYAPDRPNCLVAHWDPPTQRCRLGINKEPLNGSLTSDQCPKGLVEHGDIDETRHNWNSWVVGPCWMPWWQGPTKPPFGQSFPYGNGNRGAWWEDDMVWDSDSWPTRDPNTPDPKSDRWHDSQWDTGAHMWGGHQWKQYHDQQQGSVLNKLGWGANEPNEIQGPREEGLF